MSTLLGAYDMTPTQFALLNHLGRQQGQRQTISALANVLEVNQPGVTKIVKKMTSLGLVQVEKDEADSRRKYVSIAPAGGEMIGRVYQAFAPEYVAMFESWETEEMATFVAQLARLGGWLDENRLDE